MKHLSMSQSSSAELLLKFKQQRWRGAGRASPLDGSKELFGPEPRRYRNNGRQRF
jgi:hypothetical protein